MFRLASFFSWFQFSPFLKFQLGSLFCMVLYVPVCSLYPENLPFHLASKAAGEQSYQCNLSRCGSEWIRLQEMVWDWFSRSVLFFLVFCIQGRLKAQVGEEGFQVLRFFKMQVSESWAWLSSAWQEKNLVEKASKSPWLRYYPCGPSHLLKCPGFSLLFSVKHPSAFSLLLSPPNSTNCQCPWIRTSSQRK